MVATINAACDSIPDRTDYNAQEPEPGEASGNHRIWIKKCEDQRGHQEDVVEGVAWHCVRKRSLPQTRHSCLGCEPLENRALQGELEMRDNRKQHQNLGNHNITHAALKY